MLLNRCFGIFVCLFLQTVKISCDEGSTLAFAIDDTLSMFGDMANVKRGAKDIMDLVFAKKHNTIINLVLVTFNDPLVELRTNTDSKFTFLNHLSFITTHNEYNYDCAEMSLTEMELALSNSGQGSNNYVSNDANAKDYSELDKIKSLCQKKQSQIKGEIKKTHETIIRNSRTNTDPSFVVRPEIAPINRNIQVNKGGKIELNCITVRGYPKPLIKWFKNSATGYKLLSNVNSEVLAVNEGLFTDAGQYKCEVNNGIGMDVATFDVTVSGEPEITVRSSKREVSFDGNVELMCQVDSYPPPLIVWKNEKGSVLERKVTPVSNYKFYSKLKLINARNSTMYTCEASNKHGLVTANVNITVSSPFDVKNNTNEADLNTKYGETVKIPCDIKSYLPITIKWFRSGTELTNGSVYSISPDGSELTINSMNVETQGEYTCEATLISDSTVKHTYNIDVTISGLARPEIVLTNRNIQVKKGGKIELNCKTVRGYPKSLTKWLKKNGTDYIQLLNAKSEVLTVNKALFTDAGQYKCEVNNGIGTDSATFDVTVKALPEITISEGKRADPFKGNIELTCKVESYAPPSIVWKTAKGSVLEKKVTQISKFKFNSQLKLKNVWKGGRYICEANNKVGTVTTTVNIRASSSVKVKKHREERPIIHNEELTLYGVKGDLMVKIPCNVTGFPKPTIAWKIDKKPISIGSKFTLRGATLYINNPDKSDSADYTCEARSKLGTATKTFVVVIVDNFEYEENLNGDSHDIYAEQDKPKNIKCNLKNVGEGSVRWYIDGTLSKQTASTYTIERVSLADERNYTCRVNTDEGSESETFTLHVGFLPIFDDNSPSPTIDWKAENQMLDCTADSQPAPKYEWSHNGKPVHGNHFKQVTDWGEYICTVSNVFGSIKKTFKVITSGCFITRHIATQNQPLVTDKEKPMLPVSIGNDGVLLTKNDEIKFVCSKNFKSDSNFKTIPTKKKMTAKCITQDKFAVAGRIYRYSELQCNTKVEPSVLGTKKQCSGSNSELMRVGFRANGFLEAYQVCYDKHLSVPLYATASAEISSISDGVKSSNFKWSIAPELGNQNIGNWRPKGSCKCCFTQGQLVNVNQLAFGPAQDATFKENLNSIPIWNPCDDSDRKSWQAFDDESRKIILQEKWSSWTGASEYVPKDGGLVPRYIWKVLNNDEGFTVMVYVNDEAPVDSDVRCSSTRCDDSQEFEGDKFLYCCTLDEFGKKFGVPLDAFNYNKDYIL